MDIKTRIRWGIAIAGPALDGVTDAAVMISPEYAHHIAMVALLHAALRAEIAGRIKGVTAAQYRADLHAVVDQVLTEEERLAVALK